MKVDRRRFLVGSSGAVLALPWLESLWHRAEAQTATPPKRLIVMMHAHGLVKNTWRPGSSSGPLPATGDISSVLAPLNPIRDKILVMSGLGNPARQTKQGDNHRRANTTALTYAIPQSDTLAGGPSIDQVAAQLLAGSSPRASILLPASADKEAQPYFFAKTGDTISPVSPLQGNPREAANTLFGSLPTSGGMAPTTPPPMTLEERLKGRRGTIVDAVAKNLTSLRGRLSALDRARLDAHAEHLQVLSQRFRPTSTTPPVAAATCARPDFNAIPSVAGAKYPTYGEKDNVTTPAQIDNLIRAFACDLTRVGSIIFNVQGDPRFPWYYNGSMTAGTNGFADWHAMVHEGQGNGSAGIPLLTKGFNFYGEMFTRLIQGLAATPDIGGTTSLLDNTLVIWTSDFGDGAVHKVDDIPAILAGLTGKLRTNRHLALSGTGYTTGDLYATALHLLGAPDNVNFGLTGNLTTNFDSWCGNFPRPYPFHKGFIDV